MQRSSSRACPVSHPCSSSHRPDLGAPVRRTKAIKMGHRDRTMNLELNDFQSDGSINQEAATRKGRRRTSFKEFTLNKTKKGVNIYSNSHRSGFSRPGRPVSHF